MRRNIIFFALAALLVSCGGGSRQRALKNDSVPVSSAAASAQSSTAQGADISSQRIKPTKYTYRVVAEYPHSTRAYTQGLLWHEGYLYEGTGQYGMSELRKVEPETGRVVQTVKLDRQYFGEGIALLEGKIYQLTWQEGRVLVYDADDFRLLQTFSYDGQGWGLTTDGQMLYMTDESEVMQVRRPETFALERTMTITVEGRPLRFVNELEWVDGEIWGNVYMPNRGVSQFNVVRIDPATGVVTGIIDFTGIQSRMDITSSTDVFNGIAYDPATGNIYVTGKNWNKLYQVEIIEKPGQESTTPGN